MPKSIRASENESDPGYAKHANYAVYTNMLLGAKDPVQCLFDQFWDGGGKGER